MYNYYTRVYKIYMHLPSYLQNKQYNPLLSKCVGQYHRPFERLPHLILQKSTERIEAVIKREQVSCRNT